MAGKVGWKYSAAHKSTDPISLNYIVPKPILSNGQMPHHHTVFQILFIVFLLGDRMANLEKT